MAVNIFNFHSSWQVAGLAPLIYLLFPGERKVIQIRIRDPLVTVFCDKLDNRVKIFAASFTNRVPTFSCGSFPERFFVVALSELAPFKELRFVFTPFLFNGTGLLAGKPFSIYEILFCAILEALVAVIFCGIVCPDTKSAL